VRRIGRVRRNGPPSGRYFLRATADKSGRKRAPRRRRINKTIFGIDVRRHGNAKLWLWSRDAAACQMSVSSAPIQWPTTRDLTAAIKPAGILRSEFRPEFFCGFLARTLVLQHRVLGCNSSRGPSKLFPGLGPPRPYGSTPPPPPLALYNQLICPDLKLF